MYYINLIIIALILLTSCATTDVLDHGTSASDPNTQSADEIQRYNEAINLLNNDKLGEAKSIFIEFTRERPELAGPYANLAMIELRNKNYDEAMKDIKIALNKNPDLPQALNIYGYLEQSGGNIKSAEKNYLRALEINPDYALAHYNLALLYDIYLQDIQKAIPHYEIYLRLVKNTDQNTLEWLKQLKNSTTKVKG